MYQIFRWDCEKLWSGFVVIGDRDKLVVREDCHKAIVPEATALHAMFLSTLVLHLSVT